MCIIVYKPAGEVLPDMDILHNCWEGNSHGAGFMYIKKPVMRFGLSKLVVEKGFMEWDKLKTRLNKFKNYDDEMCIHFRLASHGAANASNTHPWIIDPNTALVHNGIIDWLGDDRTISDSKRFASLINSSNMDLNNEYVQTILAKSIGSCNKVVIMGAELESAIILNKQSGVIDNGIWYSNHGFSRSNYYPITEVSETTRRKSKRGGYLSWLSNQPKIGFDGMKYIDE